MISPSTIAAPTGARREVAPALAVENSLVLITETKLAALARRLGLTLWGHEAKDDHIVVRLNGLERQGDSR